jgi:hypothetical protein
MTCQLHWTTAAARREKLLRAVVARLLRDPHTTQCGERMWRGRSDLVPGFKLFRTFPKVRRAASAPSIWLTRYLVLAERADHFLAFRALVVGLHEEMVRFRRYGFPVLE